MRNNGFCPEQIRTVCVSCSAVILQICASFLVAHMTQPIKSSVIFVMVRPDEGVGFLCTLITGRRLNLCVRFEGPVFTADIWDIFPIHDLSTNSSFYLILSIAGFHHLTLNALRSPHQSSKILLVDTLDPPADSFQGFVNSSELVSDLAALQPSSDTTGVFCDSTLPSDFYSHTVKATLSVSTKWPCYEWKGFKLCSI